MDCKLAREIPKSFCSDDETIGLVQELYGTKVNKGICCVFRYNNCKLRSNGMPVPLLRNGYSISNGTKYR